jgi:seryl-tRNA synthetase
MQSRRNTASKEIGAAMAQKNAELAEKLKAEVADLKVLMPAAEEDDRTLSEQLTEALSRIPNIPLTMSRRQGRARQRRDPHSHGEKPRWNHAPKEHFEIGEALGYMISKRPPSCPARASRC